MLPRLQIRRMDRVLVEALPLLKHLHSVLLLLRSVPVQHVGRIVNADALAKCLDDLVGLVQEVVGVDDANLYFAVAIAVAVRLLLVLAALALSRNSRTNVPDGAEIVERAAEFVVARFVGAEVVEARHLVERRDCAAVVRRDALARVADEKRKVELLEQACRQHGRVIRLRLRGVRETLCRIGDSLVSEVVASHARLHFDVARVGAGARVVVGISAVARCNE